MSWSGPSRAAAPSRRWLSCARPRGAGGTQGLTVHRRWGRGHGGRRRGGKGKRIYVQEVIMLLREGLCVFRTVSGTRSRSRYRARFMAIVGFGRSLSFSPPLLLSLFFSLPPLSNTHKDRYIITSHFSLFLSFLTYLSLFYKSISVFISLSIDT